MNIFTHIFLFGLYSILLKFGYQLLNIVLPILNSDYNNIKPQHKKYYVCSNVLKSLFFFYFTTDALYLLYSICILDTWDEERVQYLGLMYTGLDTVSLFMVPKMQLNTKIHHISVMILHSYCLYYNYEVGQMLKIIIVYAIWSANAYVVNLYLGLRVFIREKNMYLHYLCCTALFTYVGCCFMNWIYQTYSIGGMMYNGTFPIGGYIYILTMFIIIYDDIVLMKFLYRRICGYYINREKSRQNLLLESKLSLRDEYEVIYDKDKTVNTRQNDLPVNKGLRPSTVYNMLHRQTRRF